MTMCGPRSGSASQFRPTGHLVTLALCVLASVTAHAGPLAKAALPSRTVAAARADGGPLASRQYGAFTYGLRCAEFAGRCRAAFGTVQVARFSYFRSGGREEIQPARHHVFVLFFDGSCRLRTDRRVDAPRDGLTVDKAVLRCAEDTLLDFANPPRSDAVPVDGKPQAVPVCPWIGRC